MSSTLRSNKPAESCQGHSEAQAESFELSIVVYRLRASRAALYQPFRTTIELEHRMTSVYV